MDKIYEAIKKACNSFTLVNQIECRHNGSLPLADALTPEWEVNITKGQEEVDALIDHIIGEIKNVLISAPDMDTLKQSMRVKEALQQVSNELNMDNDTIHLAFRSYADNALKGKPGDDCLEAAIKTAIHLTRNQLPNHFDIEISNMLHQLNLDRADIAALPAGATISCNITTLRNAAALIKRLAAERK